MVFKREEPDKEYIKPLKFVKPVVDEKGDPVRNMYISDDCELYDIDEWNSHDYFDETPQSPLPVKIDDHGRRYAAINDNSSNHKRTQHLARICRRAFDDPKYDEEFYRTHQVDHIDPSVPLSNNIENLEWVTHEENMYRAGKTGVMLKKYSKELIGEICEELIKGELKRKDIAKKFGVNENLIYDISIGKSHRSVTENYVDKGFKYNPLPTITKEDRVEFAEKACKLIKETNLSNIEIARLLSSSGDKEEIERYRSNIGNIRLKKTYKDISDKYGI